MGSLNIAEWSPDQVSEWLSGLGPTVASYAPALRRRGLDGSKLLTLRCDDLEYLGMHVIGHQELLLEAVEHLRNFQYEVSRECVQQLALRVSGAATALARALRQHADARLETHSLADVARIVHAVKPLVCWLDRWACPGAALGERKAALLQLALEAATCAQRDRFAEQPARAVAAAAAAAAQLADYIIQDVSDPMILQPASLDTVTLRQGARALGFEVLPSFCGHHQLAHIRFGSPAHASGAVHDGDEIVQVGARCVIGWSGEAVERLCARTAGAAAGGELPLRLRRRAPARPARTPPLHAPRRARRRPAPHHLRMHRYELEAARVSASAAGAASVAEAGERRGAGPPAEAAGEETAMGAEAGVSSSDESEPLSPPASPTHLHLDSTRMYPARPRGAARRRHSVSGGSPPARRHHLALDQFWQELQQRRCVRGLHAPGDALYRRDKAVSYSTGLELSPRPRTCLGVPPRAPVAPATAAPTAPAASPGAAPPASRGKLDKSHSTPAYDFDGSPPEPLLAPLASQTIPESPTTPTDSPSLPTSEKAGQILDFKKSSCQIGEAILQQRNRRGALDEERGEGPVESGAEGGGTEAEAALETFNPVVVEGRNHALVKLLFAEDAVKPAPKVDDGADDDSPCSERIRAERARSPPEPPPRAAPAPPAGRRPLAARPERSPPRSPPRGRAAWARHVSPPRDLPAPLHKTNAGAASLEPAACPAPLAAPAPAPRAARDSQGSLVRHITKHDIRLVSNERRALPPINGEAEPPQSPPTPAHAPAHSHAPTTMHAPRALFPSSKTRSLKKKNSILAKRREVPAAAAAARGGAGGAGGAAGGGVWQRVRARTAQQPRWARRHLLLAHNLLYAYRSPECSRADCMIYLEGFTVCAAGEVKSRAHAFKVYHTGTAFYFACDSRDAMLAWIQLIHRATLLPSLLSHAMELEKQFSETDYSETESDNDSPEKRNDLRERERERERDRDKDKSKFGSLKKLTHRMQRSESQENVSHSSTSLDRKYLRFFSRNKSKDEPKPNKASPSRAPTEQPRNMPAAKKIPKPINYIHASNPNLLDFEKSDFVTKPTIQVPKRKVQKPDSLVGLVTLEQFMLQRQAEERQQLSARHAERDAEVAAGRARHEELQAQLGRIVPDVIYGEVRDGKRDAKRDAKRDNDGYEKVVYADSRGDWRDSLRRNDKVHSGPRPAPDSWVTGAGAGAASGGGGAGAGGGAAREAGPGVSRLRLMFGGARQESVRGAYPHLQCPPTFQPESYSLAHAAARRPAQPRPPQH
ncbi:caskin-1 [Battus philenor]|uniref:caskin-1 n=1 Tax=Battus philenor TaxID=42288 RepID=UPI0035D0BF92